MSFRRFTPPDARSTRRGRSQLLGGTRRRTTLTIAALLAICYTLLTWPAAAAPLPGLHLEPRAAQLEERRYACIQGQCNVCRFGAGHLRGREALESEKSQQRVNGTFVSAAQLSAEGVRFLQVGGDWWNKCGDGWLNADMVFTRLPSGVVCEDWRTGRLIMRLVAGQGLRFNQAYMSAAWCAPSRAAIMGGIHPARQFNVNRELPIENPSLTSVLKEAGYTTATIWASTTGGTR